MDLYIRLLIFEITVIAVFAQNSSILYDAYFGKPLTERRENYLASVVNGRSFCTVSVRTCRMDEGRRVDGTCTNPNYPSRGATLTPMLRLLPPQFGPGNILRPAGDGNPLPSTRLIRTRLLGDGFFRNHQFSTLATHFHAFLAVDNAEWTYLRRYIPVSDCCIGGQPNTANPRCISIPVPADDPYLRETRIQCLNLTREETYQDYGCLPVSLPAERLSRTTPLLDLSPVYGSTEQRSREIRANQTGLLAFMMEAGREVPAGNSSNCIYNRPPETSCYNFGDSYGANFLTGVALMAMWFFREHNRIARHLAALNPCWDDEKLFQIARQINIAQYQFIVYYEFIPDIIGYKNALAEGVIHEAAGYVNDFDHHLEPGVYREYVLGTRWFHTYQQGFLDLYRNGTFGGSRSSPDDNLRSRIFAVNSTEAALTQGSVEQPAAEFDLIIDPELTTRYAGRALAVSDLPAVDFMRGRDAGLPPYNEYRKLCGLNVARSWEDFHDTIDSYKVEQLQRLYDDVNDVELMVAVYIEKWVPGAFVGPTLFCIMAKNLRLARKSDKFFFEHGDFPAALTIPQLHEIRKASISCILCDNGNAVTWIQPDGFHIIGHDNAPEPCSEIPQLNLQKWTDHWCAKNSGLK